LIWQKNNKRFGAEIKYADAPRKTPSMAHTIQDCKLDMLFVVYPGTEEYRLAPDIRVIPAIALSELFATPFA